MTDHFDGDTPWDDGDLEMRLLDGDPPQGFDCGREEQNEFLYARAWRDACRSISVTHALYIKGVLAAYVTLLTDRIALGPKEKAKGVTYQFVPSLKIAQLGVDKRFAGHGLGKYMVAYVVEVAGELRRTVGCRYVTLDAQEDLIDWYARQGFKRNKEEQAYREHLANERKRPTDHLPVSMRFDLRDIREWGHA
jgi:ribosomal protein S18 acetylase RimI-like enzyme